MSYSTEDDLNFASAAACRMVARCAEQEWGSPVWVTLLAKRGVYEVFGPAALDRRRSISRDEAILMLCLAASVLESP